jgi:hypothetical protein
MQAVVFKDKIILLRAYVKSRFYKIDFAINKTLVISLLVIVSNSELYAQRTPQKKPPLIKKYYNKRNPFLLKQYI